MKAFTPEISWHNRLPALSLDISSSFDDSGNTYRIATGGNDCRVYIWEVDIRVNQRSNSSPNPEIRIRAGLRRHQKSVGAVKFSSQHMLASGDDDGFIYLWKHKTDHDQQQQSSDLNPFFNDDGFEDLELWQQQRVLRGHLEDICDLAWSRDGQFLLSGSVDNSAILWDITKGCKVWCSDLIKGYVQGVAIDPHSQFMAAISSDRTLRIYNFSDKRLLNATRRMNLRSSHKAFFCDDTVQTFCRRLEFSPDGQFLITPTSRIVEKDPKQAPVSSKPSASDPKTPEVPKDTPRALETRDIEIIDLGENTEDKSIAGIGEVSQMPKDEPIAAKNEKNRSKENERTLSDCTKKCRKPMNVCLVFKRSSFNKPIHYYPTGREIALCVRFSPILYKLRDSETNFWGIPYRIVFAIATSRSVIIYDSQQSTPIGYASQIHLARLTDIAWSSDGLLLMISSYDGYSTLITFDRGELGEQYVGPMLESNIKSVTDEDKTDENTVENGKSCEEKALKKGQKRPKVPKEAVASKKEKLNSEEDSEKEDKISTMDPKNPKKGTPKKITPTRLPESATMWKYVVKRS